MVNMGEGNHRWLPVKENISELVKPEDKRSISVAKLKMTDLNTVRILNSISKAGSLLSVRRQMSGKWLREDPGDWWLRERDLSSSRPWPSRRGTSRTSTSSYKEENECQRKHHLLWRHLDLAKPYLESGGGGDFKTGHTVDNINMVELDSGVRNISNIISMVEDIVQARAKVVLIQSWK